MLERLGLNGQAPTTGPYALRVIMQRRLLMVISQRHIGVVFKNTGLLVANECGDRTQQEWSIKKTKMGMFHASISNTVRIVEKLILFRTLFVCKTPPSGSTNVERNHVENA